MKEDLTDFASFCASLKKQPAKDAAFLESQQLNLPKVPNEYGGIYDRPKKPKITFLQSRLNKDNFWNIMFFVGMGIGFLIAYIIVLLASTNKFPAAASIVCWLTILGVPYIVKKNSGLTFDKEKLQFFDRNNEVLNDRCPNFFLMIIFTVAGSALTALMLDSLKNIISHSIAMIIFGMMPLLIPTLYCILKNFPIAVYFRKETYIGDGTARSYSSGNTSSDRHKTHSPFSNHVSQLNSPFNQVHNPIHRHLATNIYYRK